MNTPLPTRTIRRTVAGSLAAAAGALLLLGLTACSPGAGSGDELKSNDSFETSIVDWRQKMDDCMKEAGFDLTGGETAAGEPTGSVDTSQFDMDALNKASVACTAKVGDAPVDPNQPTEDEMFDTQLAFAKCMRESGYDYPDPVKGSGGMSAAFGSDVDPNIVDACSAKAEKETTK